MVGRRARTIAEMTERRRQLLQKALFAEERALGEGRANWLRPGQRPSGGSTHHYLWLTDRRLIWSTIWGTGSPWTLPLDALTSFEERTFDGHRYLLTLRHRTVTRIEWAPRWRFLWWSWGNTSVPQARVETRFAFSRGDTSVAGALRHLLDGRGVPKLPQGM
jgi:hypothetical protein